MPLECFAIPVGAVIGITTYLGYQATRVVGSGSDVGTLDRPPP